MAIIDPWNVPIDIPTHDYAIRGRMIDSSLILSDYELMKIDPKTFDYDIKKQLLLNLLDGIMQHKCVEFTRMQNPVLLENRFRARIFVVPDEQVRILRLSYKNNNG
mgnify:CR=1 FL=1